MGRLRQVLAVSLVAAGVLAATAEAREPLVTVEPQRGIPGQLVVVTGRGFCGLSACGRVRIQLYGAVVSTGVRVSSAGTFGQRIRIPGGAPTGDVGLIATQLRRDGSALRAFADFDMAVRLRAQPGVSPKRARDAPAGRRRGADVPDSSGASGQGRNQAAAPSGSSRAEDVRAQAAGAHSDSIDGDGSRFIVTAAIALSLAAALALAFVRARARRSDMG